MACATSMRTKRSRGRSGTTPAVYLTLHTRQHVSSRTPLGVQIPPHSCKDIHIVHPEVTRLMSLSGLFDLHGTPRQVQDDLMPQP